MPLLLGYAGVPTDEQDLTALSALHAPAAAFGDTEFYPDFVDQAAVPEV